MSRKVYSTFRDNIRGVDLADTQSLSKNNRRIYLLSALNLFSKFTWVVPLKDKKKEISIVNAFKKKSQKDVNQIKYGLSKVVNLRIIFSKDR